MLCIRSSLPEKTYNKSFDYVLWKCKRSINLPIRDLSSVLIIKLRGKYFALDPVSLKGSTTKVLIMYFGNANIPSACLKETFLYRGEFPLCFFYFLKLLWCYTS